MSVALLVLGFLALFDSVREPAREREARRGAEFTAAGDRFASAGNRLVLLGFGALGAGLLGLGAWAAALREGGSPAQAAPVVGFGLFFVACAIYGPPRGPDLHFGRTVVRVGIRRLPYEAFHSFEVEEDGGVSLEGLPGQVRGRVGAEEARGLREFLADRIFPAGSGSGSPAS